MRHALAVLAIFLHPELACGQAPASVSVGISVPPMAEIEFPFGTDFTIEVPSVPKDAMTSHVDLFPKLDPVYLPFVIRGNARTAVSVTPSTFLKLPNGTLLGRATRGAQMETQWKRKDNSIGYWLAIEILSQEGKRPIGIKGIEKLVQRNSSGLIGQVGVGATSATVEPAGLGGGIAGRVVIIAQRHWTERGGVAMSGSYSGSLEALISTED